MNEERFARIADIVLGAADLGAEERRAYLDRECRGDPDLRAEVESMPAHDGHATARLGAQAARSEEPRDRADSTGMIGRVLSHYRIHRRLGEGGMGEVFLAQDERLERDVALKILRTGTVVDEQARRRFRKEALALSKLSHPNIATVFDFDTQDGVDFLVMEFVAGDELSGKLAAGPIPEKEIARLGLQLAEGLAAAHERGIVHRDLKPGNLRLTPDGRLKILDFGLAKLVRPSSETAATETMTEADGLAGTLPYMAPEQLRGEAIDARTDIWAAGVVLYEMATGRRAFPEAEGARVITAILTKPPSLPSAVHRRVSAGLDSIIVKCLEKDPERRYQSAKELAVDLLRNNPTSSAEIMTVAWTYFYARRYDDAIVQTKKALELRPDWGDARAWLAASYAFKGMHAQALAECDTLEKHLEWMEEFWDVLLGQVYGVSGRRDKALQVLDRMREREGHGYMDPVNYALVYAGLGDREQAFAFLEKAVAVRSTGVLQMNIEPVFDGLRSDPRFAELLRVVGPPGAKP
jgi:serine/threonine protein kinase